MTASKEQVAATVACIHRDVQEGLVRVFRLRAADEASDPYVRLLEINTLTSASGIVPLNFAALPEDGIHLPVSIIEITPGEFANLQEGRLQLPVGLHLGEEIPI